VGHGCTTNVAECGAGNALVGIKCTGDFCDNLLLKCGQEPNSKCATFSDDSYPIQYSNWFSEEGSAEGACPTGYVAVGVTCGGDYCDNKKLTCKQLTDQLPPDGSVPPIKEEKQDTSGSGSSSDDDDDEDDCDTS
jgi:hypothetical protein